MAEIFRGKAVAAGGFEKPVAIKRILPHLSQDRRFVELLIAEAKVLSLLKHRNIVQIFDVGLGDDGKYFLVMEYVDGKDLRAVQTGLEVRRRRMPFDLALHIGAEICEALEHAHTARAPDGKPMSLVHRDVSPSNVLLSRAGEVKLTDFGIAKRAEHETQHGAVRGKFAYISPEQARNEQLDPRSDVFSVAILLWELVCNRRLFSGLGDLEALRAVREAQVPRPTEIDNRLSSDVDALLMSALARDPTKRPTAGQLGAKLRSLRYGLEVTVGDPAAELAKIIETADEVQRQSAQMLAAQLPRSTGFEEHTEATVIRIRTADDFARSEKDGGMAHARQVIDRFEEEETKQAQLSGDQLRILRRNRRDSSEIAPVPLPGVSPRSKRPTDEPTVARIPFGNETGDDTFSGSDEPNQHFDSDDSTKLVAPSRDRRTPVPERQPRPATQPPPMPSGSRNRGPTPGPPMPGTVHSRSGVPGLLSAADPPSIPATPAPLPPQPLPPTAMHRPHPGSTQQKAPLPPPVGAVLPSPLPHKPQLPPPPAAPALAIPQPMAPHLPPPPIGAPPMQQPLTPRPQLQPQQQPPMHLPPSAPNPWSGGPPPSRQPDLYERPVYHRPQPSPPASPTRHPTAIRPWMLIVGALLMAIIAFAITRSLLS